MKENRKLLREVLKDIRRDMTDEEVLNLLADSKISENLAGEKEKYTLGSLRRAVFEGDTTTGSLMAGQVAGMLHEVRPVADILNDLWEGGRQRIAALNELC